MYEVQISYAAEYVYTTLGPGFPEVVYRKALIKELQSCGVNYLSEEHIIPIYFTASSGSRHQVGLVKADLVIFQEDGLPIVVELKALGTHLNNQSKEYNQLTRYKFLLATDKGFLINFSKRGLQCLQ